MTVDMMLERFKDLAKIKAGWLDGEGVELDKAGLDWLSRELTSQLPEDKLPHAYPTPYGEVSLEWVFDRWDISLVVNIHGKNAVWSSFNLDTGEDLVKEDLDLEDQEAWDWIVNSLAALEQGLDIDEENCEGEDDGTIE